MYYSFTYVLYLYINIDRCTEPSRSEDAVIVTALGWPGVVRGWGLGQIRIIWSYSCWWLNFISLFLLSFIRDSDQNMEGMLQFWTSTLVVISDRWRNKAEVGPIIMLKDVTVLFNTLHISTAQIILAHHSPSSSREMQQKVSQLFHYVWYFATECWKSMVTSARACTPHHHIETSKGHKVRNQRQEWDN